LEILVGDGPAPFERLGVERLELLLEPADACAEDDAPPERTSRVASIFAVTTGLR